MMPASATFARGVAQRARRDVAVRIMVSAALSVD